MTHPTQFLFLGILIGLILATVATWGRVKILRRRRAILRAQLAAADDKLADLRKRLAILNAANDALSIQIERAVKRYRAEKQINIGLRRSLGQYRREGRVGK